MTPDVEGSTLDPTEPASTADPRDPGSTQILPEAASHSGWVDEDLPSTLFGAMQDHGSTEQASATVR